LKWKEKILYDVTCRDIPTKQYQGDNVR